MAAANPCYSESLEEPSRFDFYGQINRGILSFNDGQDQGTYVFVDNSKSVSRLGVTFDSSLQNDWRVQAVGEIGLIRKQINSISQTNPSDSDFEFGKRSLRKLDVALSHPERGTFYFGQGAMASDGITGQDLSLTTVVAGAAVKDVAGGFYFRRKDGALSSFRILERFRTLGESRRFRVGYKSPDLRGFTFSAAAGREILVEKDKRFYADTAMRYDGSLGDYRVKGGAALRFAGGFSGTEYRDNELNFIASGSVLHKPSRFNITSAYGNARDEGHYVYVKVGRRWYNLLPWGWTAASIDYYYTKDGPDRDRIGNSIGLALVQRVKSNDLDLYVTVRKYEYDDKEADYFDSLAVLAGIRWRF
ncbi:MAG: porin [Paracoccaceae bacterium]